MKRCHNKKDATMKKMPHWKNATQKKYAKMQQQNKVAKEQYAKTNWKRSTHKMRHESYKRIHLKGKGIGYLKAGVDSGMCGLQSSVIDTQCQQCQ